MWKKVLPVALVAVLGVGFVAVQAASQTDPTAEQAVRKAIAGLGPQIKVDSVQPSALPGFYQAIASGQVVYVSTDGRYVINGDVLDLGQHKNLSEEAMAAYRKAELAKVPVSDRIVYAPANPKYTVTVFTDVNCGYCRALHKHMAEFNQAGIAVEYLAWPREGLQTTAGRPTKTYTEMVSVWCADDRKAAFEMAKDGTVPPAKTCSNNPVKRQFELGLRLGVNGTPAIYGPNGYTLGGYVTPEQLLAALKRGG